MNYKENVMGLIKMRNLSGPIVAKRLGVTPAAFYRSLENPTLSSMSRVAVVLEVSLSTLLDDGLLEPGVRIYCPHCGGEMRLEVKV